MSMVEGKKKSFTITFDGNPLKITTPCGVSKAIKPKSQVPTEIKTYQAIWDTGATGCVISSNVVKDLHLEPTGFQKVYTVSKEEIANAYSINIFLPNYVCLVSIPVTEGGMKDVDVLIGMNIINKGDFAITHIDGKTKFSFQIPSTHNIDFVKESKDEEQKAHIPIAKKKEPGRNDPCPCGSGKKYKQCHGKKVK